MPRRPCCKHVSELPDVRYFKPRAIPLSVLREVTLEVGELEALRLAHLEGLYQEAGAERMRISRSSFARLLDSAHQKVATALVEGHALRIEGGHYHVGPPESCPRCSPGAPAPAPHR
jgi:uncharacterized protein